MSHYLLDVVNGIFELGGSIVIWMNVKAILRDREIKGVDWRVTVWFTLWGFFNLILYPLLGMVWSTIAGAILCLGNLTWVFMAYRVVTSDKKQKALVKD